MNRNYGQQDKKASRVKQFSEALLIIGPMSLTWGAAIVVSSTMLVVYPNLPENGRYAIILGLWVVFIPIVTVISLLVILALFRVMLWAVDDTRPREREINGRFATINKNGQKRREYLLVMEENGKDGR